MDEDPLEPFGWLLTMDLHGCLPDRLTSAPLLEEYVVELCDRILDMKRFGAPLIEWFGTDSPKTEGFSLVQLIETSSVVGHFSGHRQSAHIDVFSCREYDASLVEQFTVAHFGADRVESHRITRN